MLDCFMTVCCLWYSFGADLDQLCSTLIVTDYSYFILNYMPQNRTYTILMQHSICIIAIVLKKNLSTNMKTFDIYVLCMFAIVHLKSFFCYLVNWPLTHGDRWVLFQLMV